jgi:hypothetical protein
MANRAGKKLIKATARTIAKGAASGKSSFTPADVSGAFRAGTDMGVSRRAMGRAVTKGVKQGNKAKKSGK